MYNDCFKVHSELFLVVDIQARADGVSYPALFPHRQSEAAVVLQEGLGELPRHVLPRGGVHSENNASVFGSQILRSEV